MKRRDFNHALGAVAVAPAILGSSRSAEAASTWSLVADVAECCSCEIPCPCNFGRPTKLRCDGNRLIDITAGQIDGAELAGIRFLVTFEMGKWTRIYVDDQLNEAQMEIFDKLMPLAFAGFMGGARSVDRVPLDVVRTREKISISTPASRIEMKPLAGLDGSQIQVTGLPSNAFHEYVQYESVVHIHEGTGRDWSYSGTNGFTSKMIASS